MIRARSQRDIEALSFRTRLIPIDPMDACEHLNQFLARQEHAQSRRRRAVGVNMLAKFWLIAKMIQRRL